MSSIPESGRSPGGGNGNPLQYSFLENSMNRGAWWATVQEVFTEWDTLGTHPHMQVICKQLAIVYKGLKHLGFWYP